MKKVLIVCCYKYPDGDAGAVRQHSFAKLYKELGYDVTVVGLGSCTDFKLRELDETSYISFRSAKNDIIYKFYNYFGFKARLRKFLKSYGECQYIHIVNIPENALFFLKRYAKKNHITLLHDSVEWYSPEQFKYGKLSRAYILKDLLNRKWINKQFSVIAISSYLHKHFKSRGINTVRIPVMMDISNIPSDKKTDSDITVFLYAGSPGKKDYLSEIISAFSLLPKETLLNTKLYILGIRKEQLVSLCGVDKDAVDYMGESLLCLGRVPREEVLNRLSNADFTVLLRSETLRYAQAGFPTKVVESLASGTPVVTNITSDLGLYLEHGYNSIISTDSSPQAFAEALHYAMTMSAEEKRRIYKNARKTAEQCFDYKIFGDELSRLIAD